MAIVSVNIAIMLAAQLPAVQTFVAGKIVRMLSERLDGDIAFEKIHVKPFTTLVLKNTVITDKNPRHDAMDSTKMPVDTFFRAEYIIARFTLKGLLQQEGLHLDKAYVGNAQMNLVLEDKEDIGDGDTLTDNLSRIFRLKKPEVKKEPGDKELFHIRKVEIFNMDFSMKNHKVKKVPYYGGINWDDLDIKNINLTARDLQFKGGIMSGIADKLSFREKSGYIVNDMSGDVRVGNGRTIIEDLEINDPWSQLHLPLFMMSYSGIEAFNDFISLVRLDAEISPSSLDFKTITYFAPQLEGNSLKTSVSGKMSGTVADFYVKNIEVASEAGGFSGRINSRISGIPYVEDMRIDARIDNCILTAEGLGKFISEWMKDGELQLGEYAKGVLFMTEAEAKGYIDNLHVDAEINSLIGKVEADATIENIISPSRPIGIKGKVLTSDLDLSNFLKTDIVRQVSLSTGIETRLGRSIEDTSIKIDTLRISRLHLNGYDYKDITARGQLDRNTVSGGIISSDPNCNFVFNGIYALAPESHNSKYTITAHVGHADLNAMNIDKRGRSEISFSTNADFTSTGKGEIFGSIHVGGLIMENEERRHDIGDIVLTSHHAGSSYQVNLDSEFADIIYSGSASLGTFATDMKNIMLKKELPALFADSSYVWNANSYRLGMRCHGNIQDLLSFVMPSLYIEKGTSLNATVDKEGLMNASLESKRIALNKHYIKGLNAVIDNSDNKVNCNVRCEELQAATLRLSDSNLRIHAEDDHIGAGFSYDNHGEMINRGEFIITGGLSRKEEQLDLDIHIKPSTLYLNSEEWTIRPSDIRIKGNEIDVKAFGLMSGEQFISLHGKTSGTQRDTLTLNLERFDISIINSLLSTGLGIKGAATGNIRLTSPLSQCGIIVDMISDSTYLAGEPLGTLDIGTAWNEDYRIFDFHARNDCNGKTNIDLNGSLTPKENKLIARADLQGLNIGYAQPFLKDIFNRMEGEISGRINISGKTDDLSISSEDMMLKDALLQIAYTNVPYIANGAFHLNDTGVYFDDIRIKDRYDGKGTISGSIGYDRFRDFMLDAHIKADRIQAIDLQEHQGDVFYGNLFASGNIALTGAFDDITLTVDAVTAKSGQLHIPMNTASTAGGSTNILRFKTLDIKEETDPYEIFVRKAEDKRQAAGNFKVKMRVNALPDVEAFVEIDKASGNVLSGRGNGVLNLEISDDVFNINGDYTLSSGSYKFVAMNLISRDFTIQEGSSIRFNGDIMDSALDIDAIYRTKTSLGTLIADTTSVGRRTVECMIGISDKLSNPRLTFGIEIPELDPTIESRVKSALSTDDKVQKQFLSLLLSNSFLPDEQSGIVNNSTMLYSNVTEMLANQLTNIFQKLEIPVELGLNYQPNEKGNDVFDVAVSTQLFNNRVTVNGSVGNKQYNSGNTQNGVVGDLDIEIKLNRTGTLRFNMFSHSADQYTNYLDNSQRSGIGITYQREFNTFRQFFKNMFSSRTKRQEAQRAEEQSMIEGKKMELHIKKEENHTEQDERK